MDFVINGQARTFAHLAAGARLQDLIDTLELKGDRIAVEYNGGIVSRTEWAATSLENGAKLEIVHFVGGGAESGGRGGSPVNDCRGTASAERYALCTPFNSEG